MPADERPVITGLPEIVGLVIVGLAIVAADAVTVPVIVAPLIVGVVRVLRVRVTDCVEPTTEPSPDSSPWTCVCEALARIPESAS
jgi:hypothetical protein